MCLWLAETVLQLHYRTVLLLLQEMSLSMNNISSASVIIATEKKGEKLHLHLFRIITAGLSLCCCTCRFQQIVYETDFLVK